MKQIHYRVEVLLKEGTTRSMLQDAVAAYPNKPNHMWDGLVWVSMLLTERDDGKWEIE